jgi:hypothetical protein
MIEEDFALIKLSTAGRVHLSMPAKIFFILLIGRKIEQKKYFCELLTG